ncbi:DnaD domain-containing protein [Lactiplantibacillus mudanjiangensis]|uniref:DnaB/C C-terminal domain-containing protein n=1 Tax=Lactiplantibacillus mudanjiangensis TaxID=1296538 RepID=A0A660E4M7_9LACO|nr:DnaD domain protein [Lactiplantibacillus mudanjiangensis]VDG26004.1 hypothetical protein [Lactobacillus buchneri CD034] [Lactiplantibacillus mudanjiangensis]VDG27898.1 hypothetical protein [Lactobacillus buchneri CD034] [Lactiplantibacillus mudanjiangensis]
MNWILQMKAFYDRLESKPLNASAIALWHALMVTNNKAGWSDSFTVASSVLRLKAGLQERNFFKTRNELQQAGLITWDQRKGNQSAIYHINRLYEQLSANNAGNSSYSSSGSSAYSGAGSSSPLNKLNPNSNINQTELGLGSSPSSKNNYINSPVPTRAEVFQTIGNEFNRTLSKFEQEVISHWLDQDHYAGQMILLALRVSVLSQAFSLKYMNKILLRWKQQNITTPSQAETDRQQFVDNHTPTPPKQRGDSAVRIPLFKLGSEEDGEQPSSQSDDKPPHEAQQITPEQAQQVQDFFDNDVNGPLTDEQQRQLDERAAFLQGGGF